MIKAVYRARLDGDYDFVAAFETEQCHPPFPDGTDWPEEVKEWIEHEGDNCLIIENLPLDQLVDVWSPQMQTDARTPNNALSESHENEPQKKLP